MKRDVLKEKEEDIQTDKFDMKIYRKKMNHSGKRALLSLS
jgi:hypothetical protein